MHRHSCTRRDSISRIVVSPQSFATLARCRPFRNIEFHRLTSVNLLPAIMSHNGSFRSASTWILEIQLAVHARRPFPVPFNSRLPRPRECESVQKVRRSVYDCIREMHEENARRDLNFKCGFTRVTLIETKLYFLSAKFPFDGIYGHRTFARKSVSPLKILPPFYFRILINTLFE